MEVTGVSDIRIHRATSADFERAYAIDLEYLDAIDVVVRDDPQSFRAYLEPGRGFWMALDGEQAVGCIALRPLLAGACEVKRLYVRSTHRGQRLAHRLLDALEEFAVAQGYGEAYLDSKDDLLAAIRFYERRGYAPCERYNDNPQATIFMRRTLAAPT